MKTGFRGSRVGDGLVSAVRGVTDVGGHRSGALFLHRVMRMQIHGRQAPFSLTRAMEQLRAVQLHKVRLAEQALTGISTLTPTQKSIFDVLGVAEPRIAAL